MAEFCVAEFAAAVGLPTETGKAYLGEALELRHRLPRPGLGSGPVTWRRGGPGGSPAPRSHWPRRRRGSSTTRCRGSRTGSAPAAWTGWSRRRSCGSCPTRPAAAARPPRTAGTPTSTPARCPSRAPCGSRPRSTWPTPWTWTPRSGSVPPGSPTSARPRRWTCAAPKRSGQMARHQLALDLDTSTEDRPPDRLRPRLRAGRWCCTSTSPRTRSRHPTPAAPGPGGEHP